MRLFHGSNQDIEVIDLSQGLRYKDFGQGFYLTPEWETAKRMAEKRARLFKGNPVVIEYELDECKVDSLGLKVKRFPEKATVEWASFVDRNRDRKQPPIENEYDIISGPIADDGVAYQLGRYHEGTSSLEEIAIGLQDKFLDQQYFIGTARALQCLTKKNVIVL